MSFILALTAFSEKNMEHLKMLDNRMNTKAKGDVSEAMVLATLLKKGESVARPVGDNQPYDLLVDRGFGKFLRIQVKTGRVIRGVICFDTVSNASGKARCKRNYLGLADLFAVYCFETNKCYSFPVRGAPGRGVSLRLKKTKNAQKKKIRFACDFEL